MNFFKKFNKLDLNKKEDKKFLISFGISLLGILLILIGTTYAYLTFRTEGTINTLKAGELVLTLPQEGSSISLRNALPVTDTIGLNSEVTYTFTMRNESTISNYYEIRLKNICSVSENIELNGESITPDLCIPDQYIKVGLKKGNEEYQVINIGDNGIITSGYMEGETNEITFQLKIWLAEETPNDYQGKIENEERSVVYLGRLQLYARQLIAGEMDLDISGANEPELVSGMIPVYYDEANDMWKKADSTNSNESYEWYNYSNKKWANAVTVTETNRETLLNAEVGTEIPMEMINTMFVWIARYEYRYDNLGTNYAGGTVENPGAIEINFISKEVTEASSNYMIHPAFWWDNNSDGIETADEQISGLWFAKFETTAPTVPTATSTEEQTPIIKPNEPIWAYTALSVFYNSTNTYMNGSNGETIYGLKGNYDSHITKNVDWGAAAYLTQSVYGRCSSQTNCVEVTESTGEGEYVANTDQSTTGNIYGIYGMHGTNYEYVMGNLNGEIAYSGFTSFPANKYYDKYTNEDITTACNGGICYGQGLSETSGWHGATSNFVVTGTPLVARGLDGIFGYSRSTSGPYYRNTFRITITPL